LGITGKVTHMHRSGDTAQVPVFCLELQKLTRINLFYFD